MPPSAVSKSFPCPSAQLTNTRSTPTAASCSTWYAASGRPAISPSALGRPCAASPSRPALPPRPQDCSPPLLLAPARRLFGPRQLGERRRGPADALVDEAELKQ